MINYLALFLGFSNGSTVLEGYITPITGIGGELPYDVVSENGTVDLRYCCRNDGNSSSHVTLPDSYPFMLLKVNPEGFIFGLDTLRLLSSRDIFLCFLVTQAHW